MKQENEVYTGFFIDRDLQKAVRSRALAQGKMLHDLWNELALAYVKSITPEQLVERMLAINPIERLTRIHDQAEEEKVKELVTMMEDVAMTADEFMKQDFSEPTRPRKRTK